MTSAIRTEDLSKRYLRLQALERVTLDVPEGSVYALVGPNGAGKTTAIIILINLLDASSGRAEVLGMDSKRLRGKAYERLGYVSENQEIPEWMSVGALLEYTCEFYPSWDRELENTLVKQFDLPRERKIKSLSRGMKMKLALASALAFRPKLIVLDEPFGGLDPLVRDELIEGLIDRAQECSIFISSHDLAEIETFASHVGYLEQGKLRFSEDIDSLSARFREIEATFSDDKSLPASLPASWLQTKSSGRVVRFVESRYAEDRTASEIQQLLGDAEQIEARPMGLRAIFLAMAKTSGSAGSGE